MLSGSLFASHGNISSKKCLRPEAFEPLALEFPLSARRQHRTRLVLRDCRIKNQDDRGPKRAFLHFWGLHHPGSQDDGDPKSANMHVSGTHHPGFLIRQPANARPAEPPLMSAKSILEKSEAKREIASAFWAGSNPLAFACKCYLQAGLGPCRIKIRSISNESCSPETMRRFRELQKAVKEF